MKVLETKITTCHVNQKKKKKKKKKKGKKRKEKNPPAPSWFLFGKKKTNSRYYTGVRKQPAGN